MREEVEWLPGFRLSSGTTKYWGPAIGPSERAIDRLSGSNFSSILDERAFAKLGERSLKFFVGVHDNWSAPRNRFL